MKLVTIVATVIIVIGLSMTIVGGVRSMDYVAPLPATDWEVTSNVAVKPTPNAILVPIGLGLTLLGAVVILYERYG